MALPSFGGAAGSILTGLTAMAMLSLQLAYAHGPAEWIQRGGFKNAAGELCCGERDCFELTDADVKITSAGYFVVSIKETIPFSEATPSPDGTLLALPMGRRAQVLLRAAERHLIGDGRADAADAYQSFDCRPRTNADRPVCRSRLSRSAARIARTSPNARSRSRLTTT